MFLDGGAPDGAGPPFPRRFAEFGSERGSQAARDAEPSHSLGPLLEIGSERIPRE